jgi:predicted GIY-YIG superfamily endonuclease
VKQILKPHAYKQWEPDHSITPMYYIYVLQDVTPKERYYLGWAGDLRRRLEEHNAGGNASTRGGCWRVMLLRSVFDRRAAREREGKLKRNRRMRNLLMARLKSLE